MINSERLESHNSGDIVILNREPVGNPQSCHKGFQILIAKLHQRANIIQCYVQSTLFYLTQVQVQKMSILSLTVLVELDLFLFGVPFKYFIVEFFLKR